MRARNLKPGYFVDGDLVQCDPLARILFAGLWCEADREGRLKDAPFDLKIRLLPADNCDIETLLGQLSVKKLIIRYSINGVNYIQIRNFLKHQKPHQKELPSSIPEPQLNQPQPKSAPTTTQVCPNLASSLIPSSLIPESNDSDIPPKKYSDDFEKLWKAWPKQRRCEKPEALKAWNGAVKKITPEKLLEAVTRYLQSPECKPDKAGEIFTPYPAKWLKRERWLEFDGNTSTGNEPIPIEKIMQNRRWKVNKNIHISERDLAELQQWEAGNGQ